MKLLLDKGLPRSAAALLCHAGIDAVHVGDIGYSSAADTTILQLSRDTDRIIATLDADFHTLLALSGAAVPSVVRIRIEGLRGEAMANYCKPSLPNLLTILQKGPRLRCKKAASASGICQSCTNEMNVPETEGARKNAMKFTSLSLGCLILVALGLVSAQTPAQKKQDAPPPRYEFRKIHDPYGTGKFYMDREIAHVMGFQGAGWLERPEREREEAVSKLMPSLGVKEGDHVADFGAGSGHHTVRLSPLVGAKGKVYAIDVQKEMIAILQRRVKQANLTNVQTVLNTEKDPKLPAKALDMILMVDVYHELTYPYEVTAELVKALKPGGRLVFVEFRLEDPKVLILNVHRMSIAQVMKEMKPFTELKHQKTLDHLPWQHVIIFEKVDARKEKSAEMK